MTGGNAKLIGGFLRPGADEAALTSVFAGQVRAALHRLPLEQRQVLLLAYYNGHTQAEISTMTGVPLGTVKSRMFDSAQALGGSVLAPYVNGAVGS